MTEVEKLRGEIDAMFEYSQIELKALARSSLTEDEVLARKAKITFFSFELERLMTKYLRLKGV